VEKRTQFNLWYVIIAIIAMVWIQSLWLQARTVQPITYSEFQGYLKDGKIEEISILASHIEGTFKQPLPDGRTRFVAVRVDPELARDLAQYNVKFAGVVQSRLLHDILSWVVPAVAFFAIWLYFMRRFAEKQGLGLPFTHKYC
jgi:cell division protease FtsH